MYQLKYGDQYELKWQRPLISQADNSLAEDFNIEVNSEINKVKRFLQTSQNEIPVYFETFFSVQVPLPGDIFAQNVTLEALLASTLSTRYKVDKTEITIKTADQVLSKAMQCPLFNPILQLKQVVRDKSGIVCINYAYVNCELCQVTFQGVPDLI